MTDEYTGRFDAEGRHESFFTRLRNRFSGTSARPRTGWKAVAWRIFGSLKKAAIAFSDDKATTYSAALAYYTVFSVAPLLLIAISIGSLVFGKEAVTGQIYDSLSGLLGDGGARTVQSMVESAALKGEGVLGTIVGLVTLIIGATTVFGQLQESLNHFWKVKPRPGEGIRTLLRQRLLSFTMIVVIGFLLLVSMLLSAALAGVQKYATDLIPGSAALWQALNLAVSFGITTVLFGALYKLLPDVELSWRDVWAGGAITAVFFTIGKFLIGLYLGRSAVASSYGAAGSAVVLLVWTFYTTAVLFFGAEFTRVRTLERDRNIQPKDGAEWIDDPAKLDARQAAEKAKQDDPKVGLKRAKPGETKGQPGEESVTRA